MIRHIVVWKLKETAEGRSKAENAEIIRARLQALPALIPDIIHLQVGLDMIGDGTGWDLCLIADFRDLEALRRYQGHPEHIKVAELVSGAKEQRAVVDFQV